MFGDNPLRKREHGDGETLDVQEVFTTIQGEGPDAGTPATFIRLWGCHLKCYFCDTDFESNRLTTSLGALLLRCLNGPKLVVLTGGEPMRQNVFPLIRALVANGHRVQVETAGSFWFTVSADDTGPLLRLLEQQALSIVCSPKTSSVHPMVRATASAWKYIVSTAQSRDAITGLPVVNFQRTRAGDALLATPPASAPVFLQPMDEQNEEQNKANRDLCVALALKHAYRVSIQTHKILGVP